MTAVSLINPYAPQPAANTSAEMAATALSSTPALRNASASTDMGNSSNHTDHGADNGTGTGGAQLSALLERGRQEMQVQRPEPKSVVEAQSGSDPATEFLERQARQQIEAKASEEARAADRAAMRAAEAKAEAIAAAQPEYVMPNPLPTAPILAGEDS